MKEKRTYQWCPEADAAFLPLCTAPILEWPRPGGLIVDTDASNVGTEGVLSQMQDGQEQVVAHDSKTLFRAEN
jgi:hypothetical protein